MLVIGNVRSKDHRWVKYYEYMRRWSTMSEWWGSWCSYDEYMSGKVWWVREWFKNTIPYRVSTPSLVFSWTCPTRGCSGMVRTCSRYFGRGSMLRSTGWSFHIDRRTSAYQNMFNQYQPKTAILVLSKLSYGLISFWARVLLYWVNDMLYLFSFLESSNFCSIMDGIPTFSNSYCCKWITF